MMTIEGAVPPGSVGDSAERLGVKADFVDVRTGFTGTPKDPSLGVPFERKYPAWIDEVDYAKLPPLKQLGPQLYRIGMPRRSFARLVMAIKWWLGFDGEEEAVYRARVSKEEDDARELTWWRTSFATRFGAGVLPRPSQALTGRRLHLVEEFGPNDARVITGWHHEPAQGWLGRGSCVPLYAPKDVVLPTDARTSVEDE